MTTRRVAAASSSEVTAGAVDQVASAGAAAVRDRLGRAGAAAAAALEGCGPYRARPVSEGASLVGARESLFRWGWWRGRWRRLWAWLAGFR